MHTVSACGTRNVETIVDEQSRLTAVRKRSGARRELVKNTPAQRLFTNLNEREFGCNGRFDKPQNA